MMPRQTEPNANNALGSLLRGMLPGCAVLAENTQTFADYPGRHSDVLITGRGRAPVVVEAEYEPAATVEQDARERLGLPYIWLEIFARISIWRIGEFFTRSPNLIPPKLIFTCPRRNLARALSRCDGL